MPNTRSVAAQSPPDLQSFHESLVAKRREFADLYISDVRSGQEHNDENFDDFADRANNSYNREMMFSLSDAERGTLILIDEAIQRLNDGGFGICVHCNATIGEARLEAIPWARFCIDCQEKQESGLLEG